MPDKPAAAFISYSREDSEFALRLAKDLKAAGARVWLDQIDIKPGFHWDNAIEDALDQAREMLLVLSPAASRSDNVRNEIDYALEAGKIVIPILYMECVVPLRLRRNQRIDFRADYTRGLTTLLDQLHVENPETFVLNQAAEDEAKRHAALQAREAEAQRLNELKLRQKEDAERIAAAEHARFQQQADQLRRQQLDQQDADRREAERQEQELQQQERLQQLRDEQEAERRRKEQEAATQLQQQLEKKKAEDTARKAEPAAPSQSLITQIGIVLLALLAVGVAMLIVYYFSRFLGSEFSSPLPSNDTPTLVIHVGVTLFFCSLAGSLIGWISKAAEQKWFAAAFSLGCIPGFLVGFNANPLHPSDGYALLYLFVIYGSSAAASSGS